MPGWKRGDHRNHPASGDAARLECWGEETPAGAQTSRSADRWSDDAIRREAARFAVWGDTPAARMAADIHSGHSDGLDPLGQDGDPEAPDRATCTANPVDMRPAGTTATAGTAATATATAATAVGSRFDPWGDAALAD